MLVSSSEPTVRPCARFIAGRADWRLGQWPRPWGWGGGEKVGAGCPRQVILTPLSCQDQGAFMASDSLRAITRPPLIIGIRWPKGLRCDPIATTRQDSCWRPVFALTESVTIHVKNGPDLWGWGADRRDRGRLV